MTRETRLETLATEATQAINLHDESFRADVARKIEVEIDSTRPIQDGEHLFIFRPATVGNMEVKVGPAHYQELVILWGSPAKLFRGAIRWHLDFILPSLWDAKTDDEIITEIKKIAKEYGFFGTF